METYPQLLRGFLWEKMHRSTSKAIPLSSNFVGTAFMLKVSRSTFVRHLRRKKCRNLSPTTVDHASPLAISPCSAKVMTRASSSTQRTVHWVCQTSLSRPFHVFKRWVVPIQIAQPCMSPPLCVADEIWHRNLNDRDVTGRGFGNDCCESYYPWW